MQMLKNTLRRIQKTLLLSPSQNKAGLVYVGIYLTCLPLLSVQADIVDTLNNFLSLLTGTWGKIGASIGIVSCGYACFIMGRLNKLAFISIVAGIALVFGAHTLVNHLAGS